MTKTLHMTITGHAFNTIIRRFWIEGEEFKALNCWVAAFPNISSPKFLDTLFMDVVSGNKSFKGSSEDEGGFTLINNKKQIYYFENDKSLPLYNSWDDVYDKYLVKMWCLEIELRNFIGQRIYPDTHEGNRCNAFDWAHAIDENSIENNYRRPHQKMYTDITNISKLLGRTELVTPFIPNIAVLKSLTGNKTLITKLSNVSNSSGEPIERDRIQFYQILKNTVEPIQKRLTSKYGCDPFFDIDLKTICGISLYDENIMRGSAEDTTTATKVNSYVKCDPLNELLAQQQASAASDVEAEGLFKETTPYDVNYPDAYISPCGRYFGISFQCHGVSSYSIMEKFINKYKIPSDCPKDGQSVLDAMGFVKISGKDCIWYTRDKNIPTEKQKELILEYMAAKGYKTMRFRYSDKESTLDEALKELL